MALKKSELYSSLWSSCDALRGGMDASQYKDYVLSFLFLKYVSDKYAGVRFAPIKIPDGSSFADMVKLKGKSDIGDQINKKIVAPLVEANQQLNQSDFPDFNDSVKLGSAAEKVERLTDLIAIFEAPALDFSKNRADGDDILGDAYEYLMRHFATESGKSKGQFYTPSEVSRIIAKILGIRQSKASSATTVYDPTCGSGSLLLKVGEEAGEKVTLYGQEKDAATSGLARMNMILHNNPTASITQGNTLTDPKYRDGSSLKGFDFVVANPPFSDKRWSTGLDAANDAFGRFEGFGVPPTKQGDYAYLLHIVRSLKSTGTGACILPHGVLFRGNAEAEIRRALIRKGYIKAIIGLPPNLFYGTGIPACIVVLDKKDAQARKGIFMVDASQGFIKDGPKNRLRAQDIHKIVDAYTKSLAIYGYSRMVPVREIEKNEFNLNLPRYIDSQKADDRQDIEGHLRGGIPLADIDALQSYWEVCPKLKSALFEETRPGYFGLKVEKTAIKQTILSHPEFTAFTASMAANFATWQKKSAASLKVLKAGLHPADVISELSESLLAHYTDRPLIDKYDVYQHLMDYWADVMQDDCYLVADDGWKADTYRVIEKDKKGKEKDKGWVCDLVPKHLVVARFFASKQRNIEQLVSALKTASEAKASFEQEQWNEDGLLFDVAEGEGETRKITAKNVKAQIKEIRNEADAADERAALDKWTQLLEAEGEFKAQLKVAYAALDGETLAQYLKLTDEDVKSLVVDDKWLTAIKGTIESAVDRALGYLVTRLRLLGDRYRSPLSTLIERQNVGDDQAGAQYAVVLAATPASTCMTELGLVPAEWNVVALSDVCAMKSGEGITSEAIDELSLYPCYGGNGLRGFTSRFTHEGDYVLVGRVGALCGNVQLVTGRFFASEHAIVVTPKNGIDVTWLALVLEQMKLNRYSEASAQPVLTVSKLLKLKIAKPPEIHEQKLISTAVRDAHAVISLLEARLSKAKHLRAAVAQTVLPGKVRLL